MEIKMINYEQAREKDMETLMDYEGKFVVMDTTLPEGTIGGNLAGAGDEFLKLTNCIEYNDNINSLTNPASNSSAFRVKSIPDRSIARRDISQVVLGWNIPNLPALRLQAKGEQK